jgi:hypothetical protein
VDTAVICLNIFRAHFPTKSVTELIRSSICLSVWVSYFPGAFATILIESHYSEQKSVSKYQVHLVVMYGLGFEIRALESQESGLDTDPNRENCTLPFQI